MEVVALRLEVNAPPEVAVLALLHPTSPFVPWSMFVPPPLEPSSTTAATKGEGSDLAADMLHGKQCRRALGR